MGGGQATETFLKTENCLLTNFMQKPFIEGGGPGKEIPNDEEKWIKNMD